jgi:acetolactate synthase I/II/III large subunit
MDVQAPAVFVLMNDCGYGVIRNIQDAQYEGRHVYSTLLTPDFGLVCRAVGLPYEHIARADDFLEALDRAIARSGPGPVEVDMTAIGPFTESFAGLPAGAAGGKK